MGKNNIVEDHAHVVTKRNYESYYWVVIALTAFIVSVSASFVLCKFKPTTWEYEILAKNMIEHGEYVFNYREYGEYKALLAPGYSFLTYLVYKIFGTSNLLMLFIQFILMAVFCVIVYRISFELFSNRNVALISGLLASLHPGLVYYYAVNLHNLTLYMPLFYGSILLLILCHKTGKFKFFLIFGIVAGAAVLTRATILPVIFAGILFYCLFGTSLNFRKRLLFSSISLSIVIAVNLPWAIRNYMIFDKYIFSQTNKWESFWIGNNPNATGGHWTADKRAVLECKPVEMQAEINASKSELEDNEIFKKYTFKYMREQPGDFIKGILRKGAYFWWFYPQTGLFYPRIYLIIYKVVYILTVAFAIAGLLLCQRKRLWSPLMVYPTLLVLGIYGVHTVNFMEMRHRWTVEPVLLIFASLALYYLIQKMISRYSRKAFE